LESLFLIIGLVLDVGNAQNSGIYREEWNTKANLFFRNQYVVVWIEKDFSW